MMNLEEIILGFWHLWCPHFTSNPNSQWHKELCYFVESKLNCAKSVVCLTESLTWKYPIWPPAPEFQGGLVLLTHLLWHNHSPEVTCQWHLYKGKHSLQRFFSNVEIQEGFTQDAFLENDIIAGKFHGVEIKDGWIESSKFLELFPELGLSPIGFRRIATLNMNDSIQGNQCHY